jgi:outer membrane receptor for ferrienterochelin and colicins
VTKNSTFDLNYIYTGQMWVPHFAGAPEQREDEIIISNPFHEIGCSIRRDIRTQTVGLFAITLGVKNALNSYQHDFDSGKNRDSNFVYGPVQPRSVFFSVNWKWN